MEQKHAGFWGRILRVNLSTSESWVEEPDTIIFRKYLGGRNLALHYLLTENPAGTDAFGPDNRLVMMTSVTTGAPISGQGRHTIAARSPLTGGLADAQCGGFWGAELKFASYDGLIVQGRSEKPVVVNIHDDLVEILPADSLWGLETGETYEALQDRHGKQAKTLLIGPAGENLVRYAMIAHDLHHFAGRGGLGAVMGSKKLKAIIVQGSHRTPKLADPERLQRISGWFLSTLKEHPAIRVHHELGTPKGVVPLNEAGMLPAYNFQDGSFADAAAVSGEAMQRELGTAARTCYRCGVACKRTLEGSRDNYRISKSYGGPEYESLCALGPLVGVDDIYAVAQSNQLCNALGLDTISTGVTIAWAVECFERGLLDAQDTAGIILRWNDPPTYHRLIGLISRREGFGNLLAEGSRRAATKIGRGSERLAMQVKGQEFPSHEPRGKWGVGLGYAVSPTGADHLQAAHDVWFSGLGRYDSDVGWVDLEDLSQLGVVEPVPSEDLSAAKVRLFVYLQYVWGLHDVLDWCIFTTVPEFRAMSLSQLVEIVQAITGWRTSLFELLKAGERGITMARCFNIREGFSDRDDTLPERMFEPMREGRLKGHKIDRIEFQKALKLYYGMMGWDESGVPTQAKLEELNVGWVGKMIRSR